MSAPSASRSTGRDKITGRIVAAPRQASGIASMRAGYTPQRRSRGFSEITGEEVKTTVCYWSAPPPAPALPRLTWKSENVCHDGKRQRTSARTNERSCDRWCMLLLMAGIAAKLADPTPPVDEQPTAPVATDEDVVATATFLHDVERTSYLSIYLYLSNEHQGDRTCPPPPDVEVGGFLPRRQAPAHDHARAQLRWCVC